MSVLNYHQKYTLSDAQFAEYQIDENTGLSDKPKYQDSYFSVLHITGKTNGIPQSNWIVQRLPNNDILPPLGRRVEWPSDKISALKINVHSGRSGNPQLQKYHFDVSFTRYRGDWIYRVLMTEP